MASICDNDTTKEKPRLDLDGHSYVDLPLKTYWRCIKYSTNHCHSCLDTCNVTNDIIKPLTEHTCITVGLLLVSRRM